MRYVYALMRFVDDADISFVGFDTCLLYES